MIKKYNQYIKESLLDKLEGPTEEEFLKGIIKNSPDKILELSCEENILIGVKYAVENGANINKSYNNYFGNTSICFAVNNENYEMVKYLIEHSADINVDENYPLYSALETQNYDISKLLFETGIKYHEKTKDNIIQMYNIPGYYNDDIKKLIEEYILNKPTTESLLSKLEGPKEEEFIKYLDSLGNTKKIKKIITLGEEYYKYLPDNLIVDGDLIINSLRIKKLPDNLTIKGDLDCGVCHLSFLPRNLKVGGTLYCLHNFLTELPDDLEVGGSICCSNNELTSLPDNLTVNGWLDCTFNKLTKLPENLTVNGEFWCGKNALPLKIPASAKIKGEIHD